MSEARRSRASAYAEFVLKRRWVFLILPVLLVVAAASGAPKLAFDNDYRVFFSDENPQLAAFEKLQNTYTKIDNVMFAIAPTDGELDANVIAGVEEIVAEAWKLPFVLRVDAITNYQHTVATEDDLVVADLIEGARETPDPDFSAAIDVARVSHDRTSPFCPGGRKTIITKMRGRVVSAIEGACPASG